MRRETVEHSFGMIKARVGATHFPNNETVAPNSTWQCFSTRPRSKADIGGSFLLGEAAVLSPAGMVRLGIGLILGLPSGENGRYTLPILETPHLGAAGIACNK